LILSLLSITHCLQHRPTIGILTQPDETPGSTMTYISASYVKWIESAGARVVVVPYDAHESVLSMLFESVNGLLYTGGGQTLLFNTTYMQTLQYFYRRAIEENNKGINFPIWGTCQGFQALSILTANDNSVLQNYAFDSENLPLSLGFTKEISKSKLFFNASNIVDILSSQKVTMNLHHDGVDPQLYIGGNEKLTHFYRLLSVNVDRKNKPFGSTIEAINYPFYATQWHPERNIFEWDEPEDLDHSYNAVIVTQYLSKFFVSEARKNNHKFNTKREEDNYIIYKFQPTFTLHDPSQNFPDIQTYYF